MVPLGIRVSSISPSYYELPAGRGWGVEVDESTIAAHPEDPNAKLNMFSMGGEQKMCN